MNTPRCSGILLHPTCLPSPFGIGDFGPQSHRFADQLAEAGQTVWQMLPLGPTAAGNSPYSSYSAFAGNPLLISPELLLADGLISEADLADAPAFASDRVEFDKARQWKNALLDKCFEQWHRFGSPDFERSLTVFRHEQAGWLDDYALFMALRSQFPKAASWAEWDPTLACRDEKALTRWRHDLSLEIEREIFGQFLFAKQWQALRRHCLRRGLKLMGDIPIYVAHDSCDTWANRQCFELDDKGQPTVVSGVPPDYFSKTGQLWGNPIYKWSQMERDGFAWWIHRFRNTFRDFDIVRLDHFRAFAAYWQVAAGAETAEHGKWVTAHGSALFKQVLAKLGDVEIVAENLGVITDDVEELRRAFRFAGMAVLQFGFGSNSNGSHFLPHNLERETYAYTGTHDNETLMGWWNSANDDLDERGETTRDRVLNYFDRSEKDIHWTLIRAVAASGAAVAITPMQDILGLGSEARMNTPAHADGNWTWRMSAAQFKPEMIERLKEYSRLFDRDRKRPENDDYTKQGT